MNPITLQGEKVYLMPVSLDHVETYTKWVNDLKVLLYTSIIPLSLEEEKKYIKEIQKSDKEQIFSVFLKENDKLIGNVGCDNLDKPDKNFKIGIIIGEKDYWGKGYGTDAFKAWIKYLFEEKNAKKLNLGVCTENKAAVQIYKKCGFKIKSKFKETFQKDQEKKDCYYMELTSIR